MIGEDPSTRVDASSPVFAGSLADDTAHVTPAGFKDLITVHSANLNVGDCMTYAVARLTAEPLLFVGDDFRATDIVPA
jgi:uncharacterized protein with PIN domain